MKNDRLKLNLFNIACLFLGFILFLILMTIVLPRDSEKNRSESHINKGIEKKEIIKEKKEIKYEPVEVENKISVYLTEKQKVISLSLEDYVKGVVSAEMPAEFESEALKAQAVAARTYALSHMKNIGGTPCSKAKEKGADICDSVHCQAYLDKEERMSKWDKNKSAEYWRKIEAAVEETRGEVVTYEGEIIESPYYFAISGGKTENVEDVFAQSVPYLRSVESEGEERATKFKSNYTYTYEEFVKIINSRCASAKLKNQNLKGQVKILSRNDSGSVSHLKLGSVTLSGVSFRKLMGLNSAKFDISFDNNQINIECKGNGHGVGMSQWGADAMAKKGSNYDEILKHYYSDTKVNKIKYKE